MANKEIHDLITAEQLSSSDVVAEQRDSGGGTWLTRKFTLDALGLFLNKVHQYASDLLTNNKTITGAINELNDCANIADKYDSTSTYNIGDRVIYNGSLYECNSNSVTGTWDSTKWDSTTVDDLIYSANSLDSLSDVDIDISTLAAGQTLVYNDTSGKFENGSVSGDSHSYSTTEQAVGTWIDGTTVYEKTISLDNISGTSYSTSALGLNISKIVSFFAYVQLGSEGGNAWMTSPHMENAQYRLDCHYQSADDKIYIKSNWGVTNAIIVMRYTKSSS